MNRDGLACCVRDQLRIHFKYPSHADLCEHLELVLRAWSPLELSLQHFGVYAELFGRHVAPKRSPNHLGRRKAQDAFDRWVYRSEPQIQIQCRDDVVGMLDKDTMAFFTESPCGHIRAEHQARHACADHERHREQKQVVQIGPRKWPSVRQGSPDRERGQHERNGCCVPLIVPQRSPQRGPNRDKA